MKAERTKKQIAIRFLLVIAGCALLGAGAGLALVKAGTSAMEWMAGFEHLLAGFGPWWYLPGAVLLVLSTGYYLAGKRQLPHTEEEEEFQTADRLLDLSMVFSGIASVYAVVAMSLSYFAPIGSSVLLLIVELAWTVTIQSKTINATKVLYPEKRGSVWDTRFQKDWYGSCDEAEQQLIGQCCYQTFLVMNSLYPVAMVLLALLALFDMVTPFACFLVGLLWLIQQTVYMVTAHKKERGKARQR